MSEEWINKGFLVLFTSGAISIFYLGKQIKQHPQKKDEYLFAQYMIIAFDLALFFALLKIVENSKNIESQEEIAEHVLEAMGILFSVAPMLVGV